MYSMQTGCRVRTIHTSHAILVLNTLGLCSTGHKNRMTKRKKKTCLRFTRYVFVLCELTRLSLSLLVGKFKMAATPPAGNACVTRFCVSYPGPSPGFASRTHSHSNLGHEWIHSSRGSLQCWRSRRCDVGSQCEGSRGVRAHGVYYYVGSQCEGSRGVWCVHYFIEVTRNNRAL